MRRAPVQHGFVYPVLPNVQSVICQRIKGKSFIRYVSFSLGDLERMCVCSEVDRSACTAHLAADRAHTELIWHWCAGLDRESHSSAMTTPLELDWHGFNAG
jgi:hypothetical protein